MGTPFVTRLDGPAVEREVAHDLLRRAVPVAPVLLLAAGLVWGVAGAVSAAIALALVLANLVASAALLSWTARISLSLMMGTALFGYLVRLALVFGVVWVLKDRPWIELVPLGLTIVVSHLGLLVWETRYVSTTLAFPGLLPRAGRGAS